METLISGCTLILLVILVLLNYRILRLLLRLCDTAEKTKSEVPAPQPAAPEAVAEPVPAEIAVAEVQESQTKEEVPEVSAPQEVPEKEEEATAEPEEEEEEDDADSDEPGPSIDNMQDLIFFQKLEALMAQKKLFSEPELTRDELAAEIGTNRTYLIRSIKMATGMTFNEYLNSLRVNYAANLLATTDEQLDNIGAFAGFRSKSAYYRAFTAANNCSPSEYRKRNR